jgi:hypothetical protein
MDFISREEIRSSYNIINFSVVVEIVCKTSGRVIKLHKLFLIAMNIKHPKYMH